MKQNKALEKDEWRKLTFSKFRPLKKNDNKYEIPKRLYEILNNNELHCSSFEDFNDIDECRYSYFTNSNSENIINAIKLQKMTKNICSFSKACKKKEWDLMWTHYANSHKGVQIDFKINPSYQGEIYQVQYGKLPTYEINEIEANLPTIMTTKKYCFNYEREYRAICEGCKKLPIEIKKITLGRGISTKQWSKDIENGEFENKILEIATKILEASSTRNIEIFAYKSIYSDKPQKIENLLLRGIY